MYDHKVHICVALTKSSSCFSSPFTAVGVHIRCFGQVCYQGDDPPSPAVHHDRLPQPLPLPPLPSCLRSAQFPLFTASENATCQGFCRQEDCGWSSVFTTTSPLTHTHTHTLVEVAWIAVCYAANILRMLNCRCPCHQF